MPTVTVAIPVKDGGAGLGHVLAAVRAQRLAPDTELELLVADSGSRDGSPAVARAHGAEVIEIAPERFSHGGTRNLLAERARGDYVAFLTQDAVPAGNDWLAGLVAGFALGDDVALVFGPYLPAPGASPMVARELGAWFRSFSPDGAPRIDRLAPAERAIGGRELLGRRGFFTDANGALRRSAWRRVPFREVAYAEDHALAHDMLRAGYAKAYLPGAAVIHSHDYSSWGWLRRSFDESRALRELYGYVEPAGLRTPALKLWGLVGADWRWAAESPGRRPPTLPARSALHHGVRILGALLGTRSTRLPSPLVQRLSLERRRG